MYVLKRDGRKEEIMFDLKDESDIIPAELKDNSQKKKAK